MQLQDGKEWWKSKGQCAKLKGILQYGIDAFTNIQCSLSKEKYLKIYAAKYK